MQIGGMSAIVLAAAVVLPSTGCVAPSCPGVYLSPGVHLDTAAWVADVPLDQPTLNATICLAQTCRPASPQKHGGYDLFSAMALPKDKATVRVQLALSTGRTLDQTTTGTVTLSKPFGSGCGGREEIDLVVTKAGALVPGDTLKTS